MANSNPALIGQDNGLGADDALFYKLYSGEVLAAFDQKNIMAERVRSRNITGGKSAAFANTGRAYGSIHTPGSEVLGQDMSHSETVITVDNLLLSPVFIADIFEAKNHYEVRRDYSWQCGQAMARTLDKTLFRAGITAARGANKITGLPGGTTLTLSAGYAAADDATKATEFAESLFAIRQTFEEDDVDPSDAFVVVRPVDFYRLVQQKDLLNVDWKGAGSYAKAELPMVAGFPIVVSNHLPSQADAGSLDGNGDVLDGGDIVDAKYIGDYSKVQGLVMTPEAVGMVKLIDLSVQSEYDIRRQGTLLVARQAFGAGVLRPECAQEIVIA